MPEKRIDWKAVVVATMPALAISVGLVLLGNAFGLSEAVAERLSQIVFFPVFFSTYVFITRRRAAAVSSGSHEGRELLEPGAPKTSDHATPAAHQSRVEATRSPGHVEH